MKAGPVGEMVERVVAGFDPLKVILFGPLAPGEGKDDSDADLLVVFREVGREDKRRLTVEIRRALVDVPFPKDVVVTNLKEIGCRGGIASTVLHRALHEGEVLYQRPVRSRLPRAEGSDGMAEDEADELALRLVRRARAEAPPREDVLPAPSPEEAQERMRKDGRGREAR